MRVVLVDDREQNIGTLKEKLCEFDNFEVAGSYRDSYVFLEELDNIKPEVVFIKADMPSFSGIELSKKLKTRESCPCIVLVAESSFYAVEAFEVNVLDYLVEPIDAARLQITVERLRDEIKKRALLNEAYQIENKPEVKLHVHALGRFYVTDSSGQQIKWRTKKVKEMFAYLWHNRDKYVYKALMMEELWPEYPYDKANSIFHTTMYQLRRLLKELGFLDAITFHNDDYKFAIPCSSDLDQMMKYLLMEKHSKSSIWQLLNIYAGDYFGEDGYHWADYQQLQYKKRVIGCLGKFVTKCWETSPEDEIIEICLNRMLLMDEGNEEYTYSLLKWYKLKKNSVSFLLQYNKYERLMREDFGLELPQKILQLYYDFITNNLN